MAWTTWLVEIFQHAVSGTHTLHGTSWLSLQSGQRSRGFQVILHEHCGIVALVPSSTTSMGTCVEQFFRPSVSGCPVPLLYGYDMSLKEQRPKNGWETHRVCLLLRRCLPRCGEDDAN